MHIWLFSYLAPPQLNAESILVGKMVRQLTKHMQVTLLTSGDDPDFRVDSQLAEFMGNEVILRRFMNGYPDSKIARRLMQRSYMNLFGDPQWSWRKHVNHWGEEQIKQGSPSSKQLPDLLYSRSQPGSSHLAALHMKRLLHVPWVAQFNDPWAHNPYHPLKKGDKRLVLEQQVCTQVDHAIFPTAEMSALYESLYPRLKGKTSVLPHHFDKELYGSAKRFGRKEPIQMAYVGDFYGARSPEPLLKALELAESYEPDIQHKLQIQFIGNAEQRYQEFIREYQKKLRTTIIRKPQVEYFESLRIIADAQMLVMIDAPTDENIFLSSKLIDYLGGCRPILGITSKKGTAAEILTRYGYPVAVPEEPDKISQALIELIQRRDEYMERALQQNVGMYSSEAVAGQLIEVFQGLL
ncbi:hypothetical protein LSG31_08195 [Fodinisporobacter ferrooxydans]|uniref:Glycosyl transferase family 1 domain-containing protein n=1 Tax=Fodinisporobacter ferrooxydans TaxID=2901836 RepID=A0ABY4CQC7_9BACL|nr:hypothetical protein LSG31_08195 [Alicyclobacillaceae bacterium MYW30-H2]